MTLHGSLLPALFQGLVITFKIVSAGQASVLHLINVCSRKEYLYFTHEKNEAQEVADLGSWR